MKQRNLIVIAGPTAVGKTALCIELAQHFKSQIISADAQQVYQKMNIGTAKPTQEEQQAVPHHLIDFVPLEAHYTAAQFEEDALKKLETLWKQNDTLILTGGSGLYIDAVCRGMIPLPPIPQKTKDQLRHQYQAEGLESLVHELAQRDPVYYSRVDTKNPRRILHALAVVRTTGQSYSYFRSQAHPKRPFHIIKIGLTRERDELIKRINQRIEIMIQEGLLEEVAALYPYRNYKALQTIGYQELFPYIAKTTTYKEAIERLKITTRQYAKRQMTWFRKDPDFTWFSPEEKSSIIHHIETHLSPPHQA